MSKFKIGYELEGYYLDDFFGKPLDYVSKWYFNEIIRKKDVVDFFVESCSFEKLDKVSYYLRSLEKNTCDENDDDSLDGFFYLIEFFEEMAKKRILYYFGLRKIINEKNNKKNDVINFQVNYDFYFDFQDVYKYHHFITPTEYNQFVMNALDDKNNVIRNFYDDSLYIKLQEDKNLSEYEIYGFILNAFDKQFCYKLNNVILPEIRKYNLDTYDNWKRIFNNYYTIEVDEKYCKVGDTRGKNKQK